MEIKKYIITIAATVIIASMAEVLMPEGSFKKHISLVTGLFVLFVMAKPIQLITSLPNIDVENFFDVDTESSSAVISEKLNVAQQEEINTKFEKSVSSSISEKIKDTNNVSCEVQVCFENGIINHVTVFTAENDEIRKTIKDIYGLECDFKEG